MSAGRGHVPPADLEELAARILALPYDPAPDGLPLTLPADSAGLPDGLTVTPYPPGLDPGYIERFLACRAERLAFHVVAVHRNTAGIANSFRGNADFHSHDHLGPGGLRNHPLGSLGYDENVLEDVLEEAEREEKL